MPCVDYPLIRINQQDGEKYLRKLESGVVGVPTVFWRVPRGWVFWPKKDPRRDMGTIYRDGQPCFIRLNF